MFQNAKDAIAKFIGLVVVSKCRVYSAITGLLEFLNFIMVAIDHATNDTNSILEHKNTQDWFLYEKIDPENIIEHLAQSLKILTKACGALFDIRSLYTCPERYFSIRGEYISSFNDVQNHYIMTRENGPNLFVWKLSRTSLEFASLELCNQQVDIAHVFHASFYEKVMVLCADLNDNRFLLVFSSNDVAFTSIDSTVDRQKIHTELIHEFDQDKPALFKVNRGKSLVCSIMDNGQDIKIFDIVED